MTIIERVQKAVVEFNGDNDNIDKLIACAYYFGRENATREIADKYNSVFDEQRERAAKCRYYNVALDVIGNTHYIYSPDYAGNMHETFGSDETKL